MYGRSSWNKAAITFIELEAVIGEASVSSEAVPGGEIAAGSGCDRQWLDPEGG
jgi:hypothetical protein